MIYNKHIQSFNEHQENSNIIVGKKYTIEKFDTKIVVIEKDDNKRMAFVTTDFVDKTGGIWINYNKLT